MGLTESSPAASKYKPMATKSLKGFVKMCERLSREKKFKELKTQTEKAIKNKIYGEIPQDPIIFYHCGMANLRLGYLILAEQMFSNCLSFSEVATKAQRQLALVYREQGKNTLASEAYKKILESEDDHEVAFELAQLLASGQSYDQALMYFSRCIELAKSDLLKLSQGTLAQYYMHRAAVYEALGLMEHSRIDMHHILEADPNFIQRMHAQVLKFEELGKSEDAQKLRVFIKKLLN